MGQLKCLNWVKKTWNIFHIVFLIKEKKKKPVFLQKFLASNTQTAAMAAQNRISLL